MADHDDLRRLLTNPRETLDLELKEWIDPKQPEGKAKIARGCLALRNNDGGRLVIGFTDAGLPATADVPPNVREVFHSDVVQGIVSAYAAEPFPTDVTFVEVDGQEYPVITVPAGVRTPVAAKADLKDPNDPSGRKFLVRDHTIYVRSVNSSGVVSSTDARKNDWARLTTLCFDNREADIGGFVRRHLAALNPDMLVSLLPAFSAMATRATPLDRARSELGRGWKRFEAAAARRRVAVPDVGFREAVVIVDGDFPPQHATTGFRDRLLVNAPQHTGWPPWLHFGSADDKATRANVQDDGWEALIDLSTEFDFWRMETRGVFYHLRAYEDDISDYRHPPPRTVLDFLLPIARTAEIISTGLSFGRTLGCDPAKTSVVFGFRWTRLAERMLSSWVEPGRVFMTRRVADQNEYVTCVTVPLDTPPAGITPHVENVVRGLFALFQGQEFSASVVEDIVTRTVQRRM